MPIQTERGVEPAVQSLAPDGSGSESRRRAGSSTAHPDASGSASGNCPEGWCEGRGMCWENKKSEGNIAV